MGRAQPWRRMKLCGFRHEKSLRFALVPPELRQPVRHGKIERLNGKQFASPDRGLPQLERFS